MIIIYILTHITVDLLYESETRSYIILQHFKIN